MIKLYEKRKFFELEKELAEQQKFIYDLLNNIEINKIDSDTQVGQNFLPTGIKYFLICFRIFLNKSFHYKINFHPKSTQFQSKRIHLVLEKTFKK